MNRQIAFVMIVVVMALAACNAPQTVTPDNDAAIATAVAATLQAGGGAVAPSATPGPVVESPTESAPGLLPAPLYYLGLDNQIYRIEVDGVTTAKVTNEAQPIEYFDVARATGEIVYSYDNAVVVTDAFGGNRRVVIEYPPLVTETDPAVVFDQRVRQVAWSPDGTLIAFSRGGVNLISAAGGTPELVVASSAYPTDPAGVDFNNPPIFYDVKSFSPDGQLLLVQVGYYPEAGTLAFYQVATGALVRVQPNQSFPCCNETWLSESNGVIYGSDIIGMIVPGLSRANLDGTETGLLTPDESDINNPIFPLVAFPQVIDGQLYYLGQTVTGYVDGFLLPHPMVRANPDGTNPVVIRSTPTLVTAAVWAPDASGLVGIGYREQSYGQGPLVWVPANDGAEVPLPGEAKFYLRWGR